MGANETFKNGTHEMDGHANDYSSDYEDYYEGRARYTPPPPPAWSCDALCVFVLLSSIIIFVLGVLGNGLVIWIIGVKTKRSVNSSWYLSLAVSDFLLCITVPFNSVYMTTGEWHVGLFMCKFISVVMPLNIYGSVFLLVIVSIDRCMCVIFPVWSQNHRTIRGSSVVIVAAWTLSAALSLPTLLFYDTHDLHGITLCGYNSTEALMSMETLVVMGFVFGLALPLVVIVVCYAIIMQKLRVNRMTKSSKPFRLMTAVIITFVICWVPYQIFKLLSINQVPNIKTGTQISIMLAYANSFINPLLYSFMGQDFRNRCLRSICARMENALQEEGQSTRGISISRSAESQKISL
ncbi:N-formyl peptide receptor 2-like [Engraulis encrasicolus]|uniref:N-formyl peptide receptor 2-like n=1 Tax=Engraulis encrasicolus TaxID=184585 RepID=UPI002FCEA11F